MLTRRRSTPIVLWFLPLKRIENPVLVIDMVFEKSLLECFDCVLEVVFKILEDVSRKIPRFCLNWHVTCRMFNLVLKWLKSTLGTFVCSVKLTS